LLAYDPRSPALSATGENRYQTGGKKDTPGYRFRIPGLAELAKNSIFDRNPMASRPQSTYLLAPEIHLDL
jgi:hypothetical protein